MERRNLDLRIEMLRRGLTQAEVARRAGVSRQAVYSFIVGRNRSRRILSAFRESGIDEDLLRPGGVREGSGCDIH